MRTDETIINLIFDAGKGSVKESAREAVCGKPYGELPVPTRRGYRFDGWYLEGERVSAASLVEASDDLHLVAHWSKDKSTRKKTSSLKRQKIAVIALAATAVLLLITWAIVAQLISIYHLTDTYTKDGKEYSDRYTIKREDGVYKMFDDDGNLMPTRENASNVFIAVGSGNQYRINPETGEYKLIAFVDPDSLEDYEAASGTALLLYPEISSSYVYSVEVTNEHGTYEFIHTPDGTYIEGFKGSMIAYDTNLYAKLVVGCGWTSASRKLTHAADVAKNPDGSIDYSVYGLDNPKVSYTISGVLFKKDDKGNDLYSNGKPVINYTTESDDNGNTYQAFQKDEDKEYTVYIGNMTPSLDGYYVRIEGKNSIYILNASYLAETVTKPIEEMVKPQAVYAVPMNTHSMAHNFMLAVPDDGWLDSFKNMEKEEIASLIEGWEKIVAMTYSPIELRKYTMSSQFPYLNMDEKLLGGYRVNAARAMQVLGLFYSMQYVRCVHLGISYDVLLEYGFNENVRALQYGVDLDESDGVNDYAMNLLFISAEKNENGNYYVASTAFEMIVEVEPYYLSFLDWNVSDWYEKYFLQIGVSDLEEISFTFGGESYDFSFNDEYAYSYYINEYGETATVNLKEGYIEKSGTKLLYKTFDGEEYDVIASIDFDTVEVVSYREAVLNLKKENIIYTEEVYYYVNNQGQKVRVRPDFVNNDIVRRDGVLYFEGVVNGKQISVKVQRDYGEPIYRHKEGLEVVIEVSKNIPTVSSPQYGQNGGVLDYTVTEWHESDTTGEMLDKTIHASENYSRLHKALIIFALEGDINARDFFTLHGKTVEEFLADPACVPDATIRIKAQDKASFFNGYTYYDKDLDEDVRANEENQTWNVEVKFYRYSSEKAIVTVRLLDEDGDPIGEEYGKFWVQASYLGTLQGYVEDLLNERVIPG